MGGLNIRTFYIHMYVKRPNIKSTHSLCSVTYNLFKYFVPVKNLIKISGKK